MNVGSPAWRTVASMASPRAYHVFTMLPDGNVLVTGGGRTTGQADTQMPYSRQRSGRRCRRETWTTQSSMHARVFIMGRRCSCRTAAC